MNSYKGKQGGEALSGAFSDIEGGRAQEELGNNQEPERSREIS